jgi:WD40 repeat protein
MGLRQVVLAIVIALVVSVDTVTLFNYQTNVTVGDGTTNSPVYVSSYDKAGNNLVSGANHYLQFWTRNVAGFFVNPYNVSFTNIPIDAKFKDDATWVAAIDNTTANLYLLSNVSGATNFTINQNISTGVQPTSLTWANNGNKLIVGLTNGTLLVYNLNTTTSQFSLRQALTNAHIGSVAKVAGQVSRVVSCGTNDNKVDIFNYNTTFDLYQLNQTLTLIGVSNCTAIDLAQNERRLAYGQSNGAIFVSNAQGGNVFGTGVAVTPSHTASVNALRLTSDAAYLISGAAAPDTTVHIYTKRDNFSSSINSTVPVQSIGYAQPFNELAFG